jgi:hypothetical protein
MTLTSEQITILTEMAATADGGCVVCVASTIDYLNQAFPENDWNDLVEKLFLWTGEKR